MTTGQTSTRPWHAGCTQWTNTFGDDAPDFPVVHLEGDTSEPVRQAVVAALDDLPAEFIWVNSRSEVSIDGDTSVISTS